MSNIIDDGSKEINTVSGVKGNGVNKNSEQIKHYDVGIVGWWYNLN